MRGEEVTRIAGWDTHGLPVEIEVEKELKLNGKKEIETFGVAEFNARARDSVFRYQSDWESLSDRIGYWLDYEHPYITCSKEYIETVWWLLRRLRERDLLYRGHRVLPYCPRCGTVLSSHELALGYEEVTTNSVYVTFPLADDPSRELLIWTTTPWTLLCQRGRGGASRPGVRRVPGGRPPPDPGHRSRGGAREQQRQGRADLRRARARGGPSRAGSWWGWRYRRPLEVVSLPEDRASRVVVLGRLRHRGRRLGTGPHGAGLRRRRLPGRHRTWPGAGPAGGGGRHLRRHDLARDRRPPGHRARDQRPDHPAAQAGRALAPDGAAHAHVSPLLALPEPADLLRARQLVRPDVGGQGADAGAQRARWTGIRPRSARAGSANGWRTTWTGRSPATATGARRSRSGSATATRPTSR